MAYTREEIIKSAEPDEEFAAALAKLNPPPLQGEVSDVRRMMAQRKQAMLKAMPATAFEGVSERDTTIRARGGHDIPIRIHAPTEPGGKCPLVVMYHGGGFCVGDLDSETMLCRRLAAELRVVSVNVDYRLAPEAPFPAGVEDAYDALEWAAANADSIGADAKLGFIVAGNSAGGNLANVVAHLARDAGLTPPLTGQLLMVPFLCVEERVPEQYRHLALSARQNADAPILGRQTVEWFMANYRPDVASHLYSPLTFPGGHAGSPPAYIVAAGLDPLRDDAVIYHQALQEAGVPARLKLYPGVPHSFWSFFPGLAVSARFASETLDGVRWLLAGARQ